MFGKWIIYEVQLRCFEAMTDNGDNISPQVNRGISLLCTLACGEGSIFLPFQNDRTCKQARFIIDWCRARKRMRPSKIDKWLCHFASIAPPFARATTSTTTQIERRRWEYFVTSITDDIACYVADILFPKHDSSIFRQPSNPVCGFSKMEQLFDPQNWLGSSMNHM